MSPWASGDSLNSTNLNNRMGPVYTAGEYGAVSDGSTDDLVSLQSLVNAAAGNGCSYLPAGTYMISRPLSLPDYTWLRGDGPGRTIIKATSANTQTLIVNANTASGNSHIAVTDLEIDGNKSGRSNGANRNLLHFTTASGTTNWDIRVQNVHAHDSLALGIIFSRVSGGLIEGNHVSGNSRDGITCYFTTRGVRIANNLIHDCGDDFIGLNAEDDTSSGNSMMNIVVADNVLAGGGTNAGDGVAVRGVLGATISGNVIREGFSSGIGVSNWNTSPSRNVVIANNVITDAGLNNSGSNGFGVSVVGARTNSSVSGAEGIYQTRISDNVITNARIYGIRVLASSSSGTVRDIAITNNTISCSTLNTSSRGIIFDAGRITDATLDGNSITSAQAQGILLNTSTFTYQRVAIRNNRVINSSLAGASGAPGIEVRNTDDVILSGNYSVGDNAQFGIRLSLVSQSAIIIGNYLMGNAGSSLSISHASPTTLITGSNVST